MKITSWNVNSVRQRGTAVTEWLAAHQPDALCLQELKCQDEQFPAILKEGDYHCTVMGQKAYNGVAILTRQKPEATSLGLDGFDYEEARYLEVVIGDICIGNLYLPNGNSGGPAGFQKKLDFFTALTQRAHQKLIAGQAFIFLGDYNICPTDFDFAPGALDPHDALIRPESRAAWRRLLHLGLTDAMRVLHPHHPCYTYWDYQAGALPRNRGLRIDHALLSPFMADRLQAATVDRAEREKDRASDHAPVTFSFLPAR
ncbi:exodeoxyribonuclease III [Candidatus Kirkpatrickella diaphorinae]|uniref:Exodeoxyribonuclease III n=1 Tax=Candidatus Kirkpatrickella diaphorinae TaxID=2984322 RepID=A0ABY6GJ36_9PROT|nr:exodeoxyribonuclease III [Candidatus Kirkpatrickella diaphorinae]UYH51542.1 exodeoxyribonuclease III [Candidatus Kirkpatrickella diaphorinae]